MTGRGPAAPLLPPASSLASTQAGARPCKSCQALRQAPANAYGPGSATPPGPHPLSLAASPPRLSRGYYRVWWGGGGDDRHAAYSLTNNRIVSMPACSSPPPYERALPSRSSCLCHAPTIPAPRSHGHAWNSTRPPGQLVPRLPSVRTQYPRHLLGQPKRPAGQGPRCVDVTQMSPHI